MVLLHGLGRSVRSMRPLERRLARAGYRVHNLGYPSTRAAPEALVEHVGAAIEARCARAERLHFVAHSLGGILARAWLARRRPPALGRVVMLAPPNAGSEYVDRARASRLFRLLLGPTALALGTDAASLPRTLPRPDYELGVIAGTESLNPLSRAVLDGEHDGTVRLESTRVEGMRDFIALPVNHTFIMRDAEVARQVLCFLRDGRFEPAAGRAA